MFLLLSHARQTKRANMSAANPAEYYRRAIYLPLLDCVISDWYGRFQDNILNILTELVFFVPSHIVLTDGEDCIDVNSFLEKYSSCLPGPVDKFVLHGEVDLKAVLSSRRRQPAAPSTAAPSTSVYCRSKNGVTARFLIQTLTCNSTNPEKIHASIAIH